MALPEEEVREADRFFTPLRTALVASFMMRPVVKVFLL
jgi:hypothetical protein